MTTTQILEEIRLAKGSNAKSDILRRESDNELLKRVLLYANDPYTPFNVKKVPRTKERNGILHSDKEGWNTFLLTCDRCSAREITGNAAIEALTEIFKGVTPESEAWMRSVLKKHLNIGISTRTINKVFPSLVPHFEVSLAQKFEPRFLEGKDKVFVEPKLDGVRCISIVQDGNLTMLARSGKAITNFESSIGKEVLLLGDGVYDGEIMSTDFQALMTQVHRKKDVDVSGSYYSLFDFVPLSDWIEGAPGPAYHLRRKELWSRISAARKSLDPLKWIRLVPFRKCSPDEIQKYHVRFVGQGFEGTMIKDPEASYRRGRGREILKFKDFFDADCEILGLEEGTGKHVGRLGALVIDFQGVRVNVGSGFSDEDREMIWSDPDKYVGMIAEVRYQEVTADGSLRFPTFVGLRRDRD